MEKKESLEETGNLESEKEISNNLNMKLSNMVYEVAHKPNFLRKNKKLSKLLVDDNSEKKEENSQIENSLKNNINEPINENSKINRFYKVFRILHIVKNFTKKLKELVSIKKKWRNQLPLELIDDQSFSNSHQIKKNNSYIEIKNICNKLINRVISLFFFTEEKIINSFNLLLIIIIIINILIIPLNVAYQIDIFSYIFDDKSSLTIYKDCLFLIFLTNLLLDFQNMKFYKGILVRNTLFNHLKSKEFFNDFLSLFYIFFDFLNTNWNINIIQNFKLLACILFIFSLNIINEKLYRLIDFLGFNANKRNLINFIQMIFCFLLLLHYFSCFFIFVGEIQKNEQKGWLYMINMKEETNLKELYLYSLFQILTMRDINLNTTHLEKIYCIICLIFTIIIILYNFCTITNILKKLNKNDKSLDNKINLLTNYMNNKKIDYFLQKKIRNYVRYQLSNINNIDHTKEIQRILNVLPNQLKIELFNSLHDKISKKIPFFQFFSSKTLNQIICEMEEKTYFPQEILYHYEDENKNHNDLYFFIIESGEINICLPNPRKKNNYIILKKYKKGDFFGENSLFSNEIFKFVIIASTETTVKFITKHNFIKIIENKASDYEKYCYLKDLINLNINISYNNSKEINPISYKRCNNCQNSYHDTFSCLHAYLFRSKQRIIQKHTFSTQQNRVPFKRNLNRSHNSFKMKKTLTKTYSNLNSDSSSSDSAYTYTNFNEDLLLKVEHLQQTESSHDEFSYENQKSEGEKRNSITSIEKNMKHQKSKFITYSKELHHQHKIKKNSFIEVEKEENLEKIKQNERIEGKTNEKKSLQKFSVIIDENNLQMDILKEFRYYFRNFNTSNVIFKMYCFSKEKKKDNLRKCKIKNLKKITIFTKILKTFSHIYKLFLLKCDPLKKMKDPLK